MFVSVRNSQNLRRRKSEVWTFQPYELSACPVVCRRGFVL